MNIDRCSGCRACETVCPKKAIDWKIDKKGFGFPEVKENECIHCGLCDRVCPMLPADEFYPQANTIYAAYSDNRDYSTSGGIFYAVAQKIVTGGGYVCGVILDDVHKAKHICSNKIEDIELMRDSKYIQSDISDIYPKIENLLKIGKKVMVTGTPCQISAIKGYLKVKRVDTAQLLLCDIVCHGVASPAVFEDYIKLCEKKYKKSVQTHRFRSKYNGWHRETSCNIYADGVVDYRSHESQMFLSIYIDDITQRESCTNCPYTTTSRCSDITLGDCWGIEKICPEFDDNKGISLVMCNTEKGRNGIAHLLDDVSYIELTMDEATMKQPHLQRPVQYGKKYQQFWDIYEKEGFEGVARKMYQYGWKYDMIRTVKSLLRPIKKAFKRR